jgi:hypothetical protein
MNKIKELDHKLRVGVITLTLVLTGFSAFAQEGNDGINIRTVPIWIIFIGTVALVVGSILIGIWLGKARHKHDAKPDAMATSVSGALMGLLAFILAFSFNLSMSRFDTRRLLYMDQVNAIELFYSRAVLLPDKYRDIIQEELIKYTDLRIEVIGHSEKILEMIDKTDTIHDKLWELIRVISRDKEVSEPRLALIANAMSDLNQIHNKRTIVATVYHMPVPLWATLYALVAIAMMAMGYMFGSLTSHINWTLVLILSLSFSGVVVSIEDLDRSGSNKSIIQINQSSMIDMRSRLTEPK